MAEFTVTVKNQKGEKLRVQRDAVDHVALLEKLHREGLFVIEIRESGNGSGGGGRSGKKKEVFKPGKREAGIKLDRLVFFTRQLATMIAAGIPIVKIVRSLAAEEKGAFRKILRQVADDVEQGSTFSDSLRKHPKIFGRLYTALVNSGEESGKIDSILEQLANYLEVVADIRMKVKSALRYPIFIFSFIALILMAFILFIIPRFAQIYDGFDAKLPAPTQAVLTFSAMIRDNILVAVLVLLGLIVLLRILLRTERGAYLFDQFKLSIPGLGEIFKKTVISRVARTLGVLIQSGMPIVQALNVVRRAADNKVYERGIQETKRRVEEGQPLAEALQGAKIFPSLVLQMVSTGEQSG
ncbi:type II secretion system F family protein, partial [Candidatus Zixiibacteriota bacterium]